MPHMKINTSISFSYEITFTEVHKYFISHTHKYSMNNVNHNNKIHCFYKEVQYKMNGTNYNVRMIFLKPKISKRGCFK